MQPLNARDNLLEALQQLLSTLILFVLVTSFGESITFFFAFGGDLTGINVVFGPLLVLTFVVVWPTAFTAACCYGSRKAQESAPAAAAAGDRAGDPQAPDDEQAVPRCCCDSCLRESVCRRCICCTAIPLALYPMRGGPWWLKQLWLPVALLLSIIPFGFIRVFVVSAAVVYAMALVLQTGHTLKERFLVVSRAGVISLVCRLAYYSSSVFLYVAGAAATLSVLGLLSAGLNAAFRKQALLSSTPVSTPASDSPSSSPTVVAVAAAVYFTLAQWLILAPAPILALSAHQGSLSSALAVTFSVVAAHLVVEILHTINGPALLLRASPVVSLVLVISIGVGLHADATATRLGFLCVAAACHTLLWPTLALNVSSVPPARRLHMLRVFGTALFVCVFLTSIDWLGAFPPPVFLLVWLLTVAVAASFAWLGVKTTVQQPRPQPSNLDVPGRLLALIFFVIALTSAVALRADVADSNLPVFDGTLTVGSFNIQRGYNVGATKLNLDDVADELSAVPLVGLQESYSFAPTTGGKDAVSGITEQTGHAAYRGVDARFSSFDGTAILTQYPIVGCLGRNLPWEWPWSLHSFSACRVLLNSTTPVVLVSMHPTVTPRDQLSAQVESAAHWINEFAGSTPVIVVGDFNAEPDTSYMRPLRTIANLTNAFNPQDLPNFKYPVTRPGSDSAIDSIWFKGFSSVLSATVVDTGGMSDHLLVLASFQL